MGNTRQDLFILLSYTARVYSFGFISELFIQISELKTFYTDAVKYLPKY